LTQLVRAKISALGTYVPPRVLTNADMEKMVETSDEWLMTRTGIRERHIVDKGVATSDLAVEAAKKALAQRGILPTDLEAIIVGTVTPDMFFPSTACLVQNKLGAKGVWGFDLSAASRSCWRRSTATPRSGAPCRPEGGRNERWLERRNPTPGPSPQRGGEGRGGEGASVRGGGARRGRRGRGHEVLEDLDQRLPRVAVELLVLLAAQRAAARLLEHVLDDGVAVVGRDARLDEQATPGLGVVRVEGRLHRAPPCGRGKSADVGVLPSREGACESFISSCSKFLLGLRVRAFGRCDVRGPELSAAQNDELV